MTGPDIAERARQLHEQGLGIRDIAIMLNTHDAQVQRWLALDHERAAAVHARAWQERRQ
jgi:hypothetical protein